MHQVIAEIIDDNSNKSLLVCENKDFYAKSISNRGLEVFQSRFIEVFKHRDIEVDAALIDIDLSILKANEYLKNILTIFNNIKVLKKIYIIVSNSQDLKSQSIFCSSFKIKFNEIKIKRLMSKKFNFCTYETQYILEDNDKVQAVLPFFLVRKYYRRSWKLTSVSFLGSAARLLKYFFIKYIPFNLFSNILIVFECDK